MSDPNPSESPFGAAFRAAETPRLAGYTVGEVLGAGGHSTVYLAEDAAGQRVAIKHWKVAWAPEVRARLEREVAALRELDHPNLVRFLGLSEDAAGAPAIVMEAVPGESLAARIAAEGPLAPAAAAALARELCAALSYLAARGLVHRDLKPANVIVRPDGRPVLVDFSVAKRLEPSADEASLTSTGAAVGTSAYMAPEQCAGDLGPIDARTDVYGLGALLFQALTGLPPWTHESGWERTQRNPWRQPYPAQPAERARVEAAQAQVPPVLGALVARCLEGEPAQRYPDAASVAAALATPAPAPPQSLVIGTAALGLCLLASYGIFHHASRSSPNHGQNQEEPMKTATLALLTTLSVTPLAAAQTSATPSAAPVTSTGIGPVLVRALRDQDLSLFQTILQPKRPRDLERAIERFRQLSADFVGEGLELSKLRYLRALDSEARPLGESRLSETNVHVEVACGARRMWIGLDDCVRTPAGWRLTKRTSGGFREEPEPRTRRGSIYPSAPSLAPLRLAEESLPGLRYVAEESGAAHFKSQLGPEDPWLDHTLPLFSGEGEYEVRAEVFRDGEGNRVVVWLLRFPHGGKGRDVFGADHRGPARDELHGVLLQQGYVLRASNLVVRIELAPADFERREGEDHSARAARLRAWARGYRPRLAPLVERVAAKLAAAVDAPVQQRESPLDRR